MLTYVMSLNNEKNIISVGRSRTEKKCVVWFNLFVIDLSLYGDEDPSLLDVKKVFINPKILKESGELKIHNEGCLSIPGIREDISRKSKIKIKYLDANFNSFIETIDGLFARVFQHEYDHLDGILFIDHLSALRKNIVNRKLTKIQKGKFEELYPTLIV